MQTFCHEAVLRLVTIHPYLSYLFCLPQSGFLLTIMALTKCYLSEEINYLMMCTDVNNDGKVDYMEFTERFHNPAKDIGFNLAVLLTNLKEHISNDPRLDKIIEQVSIYFY